MVKYIQYGLCNAVLYNTLKWGIIGIYMRQNGYKPLVFSALLTSSILIIIPILKLKPLGTGQMTVNPTMSNLSKPAKSR